MNEFLFFFELMPTWQKLVRLVGCLSVFWALEGAYPLMTHSYKKWKHAKINFGFLSFTLIINILFGILALGVFNWLQVNQFG